MDKEDREQREAHARRLREQREAHARRLRELEEGMSKADLELLGLYKRRIEGTSEDPALHTGGLLEYALWQIIYRWLEELGRTGLTGDKESGPVDVPQEEGYHSVQAKDGRQVWIRPGHDEDGYLRTEVRERYGRTDGAILAMLAVLEGGEGPDEPKLREAYSTREAPADRLLDCAEAMARHYRTNLDTLGEPERREIIVGFALRISSVAKSVHHLQAFAEKGSVDSRGDPTLDVRAAELRRRGHTSVEIGQMLGFPQSHTEVNSSRRENRNATNAADRGEHILGQLPE